MSKNLVMMLDNFQQVSCWQPFTFAVRANINLDAVMRDNC
jgi:hypothetical protein